MKKAFLLFTLAIICIISVFGQTPPPPIWTTVSGSTVRNVSINSVKTETLRLADQYRFYGILDENRTSYRSNLPSAGNGPILRTWVNNNQNYVYALQDRTNLFGFSIDLAEVNFVIGDRVYSLHFHPNSSPLASNSVQNDRRYLEQLIDTYIAQMSPTQVQPPTSSQRISSIIVVNNTGYTCDALWIRQAGTNDWGSRHSIEDGLLRTGRSSLVYLSSSINTANRYDVALRDTDGDFYIRNNIQITANGLITFTFSDFVRGRN